MNANNYKPCCGAKPDLDFRNGYVQAKCHDCRRVVKAYGWDRLQEKWNKELEKGEK